jgi:hypothetical protein
VLCPKPTGACSWKADSSRPDGPSGVLCFAVFQACNLRCSNTVGLVLCIINQKSLFAWQFKLASGSGTIAYVSISPASISSLLSDRQTAVSATFFESPSLQWTSETCLFAKCDQLLISSHFALTCRARRVNHAATGESSFIFQRRVRREGIGEHHEREGALICHR